MFVIPANLVLRTSSYSCLMCASRSLRIRSHISPTCLKVNRGASRLDGDNKPIDVEDNDCISCVGDENPLNN